MPHVKHTKTELKAQREALTRFERFLPMLQLKKQQLQMEVHSITEKMKKVQNNKAELLEKIKPWIKLFSEPVNFSDFFKFESILTVEGNVAGVEIPLYQGIKTTINKEKMLSYPPWVDDAVKVLKKLMEIEAELKIYAEQKKRIEYELRVTSQRVNLFEKVKIPECKENIRIIKIFIGDEQTASVARSKTAKKKLLLTTAKINQQTEQTA